jgi:flagellar motor switch protein FliG
MTSGVYKSAVVLASLGADAAARVLSEMDDGYVEILVREMSRMAPVRAEERDEVLEEFTTRLAQGALEAVGGMEYARRVLEQALGPERASQLLGESEEHISSGPPLATILETTSPESLAALVADEHPQLISLLSSQLPVEQAAALLAALPPALQGQVAARLAEMEPPAPVALQHLERCLMEKLRGEQSTPTEQRAAGPRRVADILGKMRRSVETNVLAALEAESPELAEKVNQHRFGFEHLLQLPGRELQRVLRDVESDTLRLAMKGLDEEQQQSIFSNMSERAAARLREDLESTGPTRLRDVETAQQHMVSIARALMESGEVQVQLCSEEGDEGDAFV